MYKTVTTRLHLNTVGVAVHACVPQLGLTCVGMYVCVSRMDGWILQKTHAAFFSPPGVGGFFFLLFFMSINTCPHRMHVCLFLGCVWLASRVITFPLEGISIRMQMADVTHTHTSCLQVPRVSRWLFAGEEIRIRQEAADSTCDGYVWCINADINDDKWWRYK